MVLTSEYNSMVDAQCLLYVVWLDGLNCVVKEKRAYMTLIWRARAQRLFTHAHLSQY